jgi:hypothetical protein
MLDGLKRIRGALFSRSGSMGWRLCASCGLGKRALPTLVELQAYWVDTPLSASPVLKAAAARSPAALQGLFITTKPSQDVEVTTISQFISRCKARQRRER